MRSDIFFGIALILVAGGIALVLNQVFALFTDLAAGGLGLIRRKYRPVVIRNLTDLQIEAGVIEPQADVSFSLTAILSSLITQLWFWIAVGAIIAIILSDPLLSSVAFGISVVAGSLYRSQHHQERLRVLHQDASELVTQFASRYPLARSVVRALTETADSLPKGEIQRAVRGVVRSLQVNQPIQEAISALRSTPVPSLGQLGTLLTSVQQTSPEVFQDSLGMLRLDVEEHREFQNLSRQALTLTRSTARILQAVLAGTLIFASTVPNWRVYFLSHLAFFWGAMLAGAVGSFYIETEIRQLER